MIVSKQNLTGKLIDKQSIQGKINKATEYIKPITQEKTIVPTKQIQEVLPDENVDLLSKVIVNAIPNEYIVPQGEIEITENGITDVTQYAIANVNVSGAKVYPPDWSEIGYSETPQNILDDFDYSKDIKDNWDSSVTNLSSKFSSDTQLVYMPLVDTSNATNMNNMFEGCSKLLEVPILSTSNVTTMQSTFAYCSSLIKVPLLDTSKVTNMKSIFYNVNSLIEVPQLDTGNVTSMNTMFRGCSVLENVPILNTSKCKNFINTFAGCTNLSNDSLNNIMQMCINAASYTDVKTLKIIGLSSAQATTCQSLSNYQAFLDAGWTTGY